MCKILELIQKRDNLIIELACLNHDLNEYSSYPVETVDLEQLKYQHSFVIKEIQQIARKIAAITEKSHESLKVDVGDNYWGYMADLYLSNPTYIKVNDKKYGSGASKFIGEVLKFYSENNK